MASKWWVFIGTILCFTPLFPIGICLIAYYIIDLLFKNGGINTGRQYIDNHYTQNIGEAKFFSGDDKKDEIKEEPMDYMNHKTREENA